MSTLRGNTNSERQRYRLLTELLTQAELQESRCLIEGHQRPCSGNIIGAHYVQEARLKQISTRGKVITFARDIRKYRVMDYPELRRTSNRLLKASMACRRHDQEVFGPIENADIDTSNHRHCLLLAYRSVLIYIHNKQLITAWHEKFISHGRRAGLDLDYSSLQNSVIASTQEAHEAKIAKNDIEKKIFGGLPDDWEHFEIVLDVPASVAGAGFLCRGEPLLTVIRDAHPLLRLDGYPPTQTVASRFEEDELIKIRENGLSPNPLRFPVVFSVYPENGMQKAVVSYPARAHDYAHVIVSAIDAEPEERSAHLSRILLDETELLMISPAQWDTLSEHKRARIKEYFMSTVIGDGELIEDSSEIDLWTTP